MKTKNKALNKVLSFLLVLAMICGSMVITGWGTETAYAGSSQITVYMTVSNQGGLAISSGGSIVAQVPVTVTEADPTLDDALSALHEQYYSGGSSGYATADSMYGKYVTKLWGDSTSESGYYRNNKSTLGVGSEPVEDGDYITAYLGQGSYPNSDQYGYFNINKKTILAGDSVTLTLNGDSWGTSAVVSNAGIYTIDADTGDVISTIGTTDKNGQVTFKPDTAGTYYITASCTNPVITTPFCKITAISSEGLATGKDYVTIRIEGNGIGTDGTSSSVGTVLDEAVVYFDDLKTSPKAIDAVNKALEDAGLTGGEKNGSIYTTFGGVGVTGNNYWRFSVNDEAASDGLDGLAINNKDRIVLDITDGDWTSSTFNNEPQYSYFKVVSCEEGSDYGYPKADIKLALYKLVYDSNTWTASAQPVTGASITGTGSWSAVTTDEENGIAEFTLWGTNTGAGTYCFNISADKTGISRPYCQVILIYDGTNNPAVYISQPSAGDTSLNKLELYFPGTSTTISGINYIDGSILTVGNGMTSVSLSAIDVTTGAIATVKYKPAGGSFGSTVTYSGTELGYNLAEGENVFKITVINGSDQEVYTLTIKRSEAGTDTTDIDVAAVIDGIRDVNDTHAASYYTNDWVLGMAAAGITPSSIETDKYLANVLNLVVDGSTSVATKAKTAIALTAMNIDARQVANKNGGQAIDLIDEVASYSGYTDPVYTAPFILSLYDLSNYAVPSGAVITRAGLIKSILDAQETGGSWYVSYGADATGMVLPALAPYYNATAETNGISAASCAAITVAVNHALTYLSDAQSIDGSFPGYGGTPNSNTMIADIVGINALELNPNTDSRFVKSGMSALKNLLTYQTSDNKLGYTDNSTPNDLACQQGLGALATYQNLSNTRSSNLYHFTKAIEPYTSWPDADLLTSIKVTAPTNTVYSYNASETSDTVDTGGMTVTGIYNGDASNTTSVAISSCTISTLDRSSAGTQTVTVSYQGCIATFMVTVKNSDGTLPSEKTVSIKVKKSSSVIASDNSVVIEAGETTAMDVLKTVLDDAGIDYVIKGNYYVSEIDGLGEFDEGEDSGWLYSVNGVTPPTTAASEYELEDGDAVVWYYTLDYTTDSSTSNWKKNVAAEEGASTGVATVEVTSKIDASGKATAAISKDEMSTAISNAVESAKKAGEDSKTEVQITVKGADNASSVETTLPKASLKDLNEKIDVVTIKTPVANISLDKDTIKTLSAEANGDVKITVSKLIADDIANLSEEIRAEIGDKPVFDFSIKSGSKTISEFNGKVTITVPYTAMDQELANGLVVYYINDQGSLEIIKNCIYDEKTKTMTFTTQHFSKYAIGYKSVDFTDVSSHWAKDYITYLAVRDVISGMTQATFAPNSNITRAQFVQILANLSGADLSSYGDNKASSFSDVSENAWYAKAAAWAADNGIATGIKNKDGSANFSPDANISRQDMAVMILRYTEKVGGYSLTATSNAAVFSDGSQIADYAKEAVTQLQQAGLLNGKTSSTFAPKNNATRAESVKMISMLVENSL